MLKLLLTNRDPSQTTTLRNRFARDMRTRFAKLEHDIVKAVVTDDVLGLSKPVLNQSPGYRAFDFPRSTDKIQAFMEWLEDEINKGILETTQLQQLGRSIDQAWTNIYISDSYRRGVMRARYQLTAAGFDVPPLEQTGGIAVSMSSPFHVDRLGLLYTRAFNDLKGITSAMDTQISRVLSQGLADGLGAREIARDLRSVLSGGIVDTLGRFIPAKRRAELLARTEIIRAHAEAQLQEFKSWQIAQVTVKAELVTAGDNRVCNQCADLERSVFTLEEAQGMIPVHASCRCAWIPFNVSPGGVN
jgi:SPP1 gp7 family putative phage head morphogenesis protein